MSNSSGSHLNKGRGKWTAPRDGEPNMKTINGKPFKYNNDTKLWDKPSEESTTMILSAANMALESNSENNIEPVACIESLANIVQNRVLDDYETQEIMISNSLPNQIHSTNPSLNEIDNFVNLTNLSSK